MFVLEWIAGVLGIGAVVIGLVVVRLAYGPLSTDILTPYLARALSSESAQLSADIMHSTLSWDRTSRELGLQLSGVSFNNAKGQPVITVPDISLRLDALTLLVGRMTFEDVRVNGVNIQLERTAEGHLTFPGVTPQVDPSPVPPPSLAGTIGDWPRRLAELDRALSRLRSLSITAVQVTLTDRAAGTDAADAAPQVLTLPDFLLTEKDGRVQGIGELRLALKPTPLAVTTTIDLSPTDGSGAIKLEWDKIDLSALTGIAPALEGMSGVKVPLTGDVTIRYEGQDKTAAMEMLLNLQVGAGSVQLPGIWPEAVPVKGANLALTTRATPKDGLVAASLDKLSVDMDGPVLSATGNIDVINKNKRSVRLAAELKDVPVDRLASLWPPAASSGSRDWVTTHLSNGQADGTVKVEGEFGWPNLDEFKIGEVNGTINMAGTTVNYLPDLPPVTGAAATATYDAHEMNIAISTGDVNGIAVQPSDVKIVMEANPIESLVVKAHGIGKISKVLEIIDHKPLEYAKKVGLAPGDMEGDADFMLTISFPLLADLPLDKVDVGLDSTVRNFASDKLVGGLSLTGGVLKAGMTTTDMTITGTVNANSVPTNVNWKEVFSPQPGAAASTVTATLGLDNIGLEKFGIVQPSTPPVKYIDGALVPVTVKYLRYNGKGTSDSAQIDADLTPTALHVKPLGFEKKAGDKGSVSAKVKLPPSGSTNVPVQVTGFTAIAPGLDLTGNANLEKSTLRIQQVVLTRGRFGASNITANLRRIPGTTDGWQGTVAGPVLDIGALRDKTSKESTPLPPLDLKIDIDRAVFAPDRTVAPLHVTAKRSATGWQTLDVELMAGMTPFSGRLAPKSASDPNAGQTLRIETPSLGAVLRATDQTDTVLDGKLIVRGESAGPDKPIVASVVMTDYRLQGMPFIASLVSAISAEGLMSQLFGQEGLHFNRLKGTIEYTPANAKADELVKIRDAKTSGGALGLTIAGTVNMSKNTVDINGTAVPFNSVNSILGNVPLIGGVLGGSSGVFAATYRATGPFDNIKVSVNPLSILAPGFLRGLFFGD